MDVGNQGQRAFPANLRKGSGGFHVGNRQPGNLTAGRGQLADLLQGSFHIGSFGIEHGLDHHRSAAANGDSAN